MRKVTLIRLFLLSLAATGVTATGSYADQCVPDPTPRCYLTYIPVTCNNGVTYTNQCFADADCAKGCHPGTG